jgi:hypothetical protein
VNRLCFRDFRTRLAGYSESIGNLLGLCNADIPAQAAILNAATERLLYDPMAPEEGWWGAWAKFRFNVSREKPYLTCPRGVARAIVMDVSNHPTPIQNGFFEFLDFGRGLQDHHEHRHGGVLQAYDRDYVPTLGRLARTPQQIQVFPTDARDVGRTIIVQGRDQNGNVILGTDPVTNRTISGESLILAQPFILSLNQFSEITGIEKDGTYGPVTIMQMDPLALTSAPLSFMEPSETSAAYRQYLVGGLDRHCQAGHGTIRVTAQCKLEFTPVSSDSDYLLIGNIPALIEEVQAIRLESQENTKSAALAAQKHAKAIALLFGQLDHAMGRERPAISVSVFGSAPLERQFQ